MPGAERPAGDDERSPCDAEPDDPDPEAADGTQPSDVDVLLTLPETLRAELRDPMGPVHADVDALAATLDGPVVAVGDVVAAGLVRAGRPPAIAVVDGRTERRAVHAVAGPSVAAALAELPRGETVPNPPGGLSAALLAALRDAVDALPAGTDAASTPPPLDDVTVIDVEGEEDLAVLPALLLAPAGATVLYGQPDEGAVAVTVDGEVRSAARELFERFEGDHERARAVLGLD